MTLTAASARLIPAAFSATHMYVPSSRFIADSITTRLRPFLLRVAIDNQPHSQSPLALLQRLSQSQHSKTMAAERVDNEQNFKISDSKNISTEHRLQFHNSTAIACSGGKVPRYFVKICKKITQKNNVNSCSKGKLSEQTSAMCHLTSIKTDQP